MEGCVSVWLGFFSSLTLKVEICSQVGVIVNWKNLGFCDFQGAMIRVCF